MKQTTVQVKFDSDRYTALLRYAGKKDVPVEKELDLKKAAKAVGAKSIHMLKAKDLLGLTGYVHGGCSPIGMKKLFPTVIHTSAEGFDTIFFSGGKIGYQGGTSLEELKKGMPFRLEDVVVS